MAAGGSAEEQSERSQAAAVRATKRAANAQHRSDRFAAGAAGERAVAEELAPLSATGWYLLHDRRCPTGGNIDHIAIGPPGIYVIDAKNWTYALSVTNGRIKTGMYSRQKDLDRLLEYTGHVRNSLDAMAAPQVRSVVALTGTDSAMPALVEGDATFIGVSLLRASLTAARRRLTSAQVETAMRTISLAFPQLPDEDERAEDVVPEPLEAVQVGSLFERGNRIFYLRTWRQGGAHRLYMVDQHGFDWGSKDVVTGKVSLTAGGDPNDAQLALAVLQAATPTGVPLSADALPKVPMLDSRTLSRIGKLFVNVLVGQEWKKGPTHRLYGTYIAQGSGTFKLGHVDLKDRSLHPSVDGPLGKDLSKAVNYLRLVLERQPAPGA